MNSKEIILIYFLKIMDKLVDIIKIALLVVLFKN